MRDYDLCPERGSQDKRTEGPKGRKFQYVNLSIETIPTLSLASSHVQGAYIVLAVAAFAAGRILGLDQYIEQYEIGGQALVERYPALEYILG